MLLHPGTTVPFLFQAHRVSERNLWPLALATLAHRGIFNMALISLQPTIRTLTPILDLAGARARGLRGESGLFGSSELTVSSSNASLRAFRCFMSRAISRCSTGPLIWSSAFAERGIDRVHVQTCKSAFVPSCWDTESIRQHSGRSASLDYPKVMRL